MFYHDLNFNEVVWDLIDDVNFPGHPLQYKKARRKMFFAKLVFVRSAYNAAKCFACNSW